MLLLLLLPTCLPAHLPACPPACLQYGAFTPCIFYALLGSSRQLVSRAAAPAASLPSGGGPCVIVPGWAASDDGRGLTVGRMLSPDATQAVGPVAVTSLILGSGLSDIYGKFAVNPRCALQLSSARKQPVPTTSTTHSAQLLPPAAAQQLPFTRQAPHTPNHSQHPLPHPRAHPRVQ